MSTDPMRIEMILAKGEIVVPLQSAANTMTTEGRVSECFRRKLIAAQVARANELGRKRR